jgi:hypothetical protein
MILLLNNFYIMGILAKIKISALFPLFKDTKKRPFLEAPEEYYLKIEKTVN